MIVYEGEIMPVKKKKLHVVNMHKCLTVLSTIYNLLHIDTHVLLTCVQCYSYTYMHQLTLVSLYNIVHSGWLILP